VGSATAGRIVRPDLVLAALHQIRESRPITTRTGAVTSASRASAGSWLVRVMVAENAFARP
jgi:hypothetical protein